MNTKPSPSAPLPLCPSAPSRARRAFTLVEIIVVIIINGILAAVIAPRLIGRVGQAKTATANANANSLATAIKLLQADCGGLPTDTTIQALWECPSGLDKAAWKGPYVDSADKLLDPWGRPFILVIPGQKNIDFDVVSYGADGTPGGEGENVDVRKP